MMPSNAELVAIATKRGDNGSPRCPLLHSERSSAVLVSSSSSPLCSPGECRGWSGEKSICFELGTDSRNAPALHDGVRLFGGMGGQRGQNGGPAITPHDERACWLL